MYYAKTKKELSYNQQKNSTFLLSYDEKNNKTEVKIKKPTKRKK